MTDEKWKNLKMIKRYVEISDPAMRQDNDCRVTVVFASCDDFQCVNPLNGLVDQVILTFLDQESFPFDNIHQSQNEWCEATSLFLLRRWGDLQEEVEVVISHEKEDEGFPFPLIDGVEGNVEEVEQQEEGTKSVLGKEEGEVLK